MKSYFLPLFVVAMIVLTVIGCATVHREIGYYEQCINDDECRAKIQDLKVITANTVKSSNAPGNDLAFVLSNLVSALGGLVYGRKVAEKKKGC